MTLNITVATNRCIYQCADFRLLDWVTGEFRDFESQKIALVNTFEWSASICFAGVGRTSEVDVSRWLAVRVGEIQGDDPFERLINEILKADLWLSGVPVERRKHSFSIGAFIGSQPRFVLISNFQQLAGPPTDPASSRLSVHVANPDGVRTFLAGQTQSVDRAARRRLEALAESDPEPERMYAELAAANRLVADRNPAVSPACFTTHLRLTGDGGGRVHGMGAVPYLPPLGVPAEFKEAISSILDKEFGPGRGRVVSTSFARVAATDDYHATQLREKPDDPNVHSNYGAYLKETKQDDDGAETEYRKALELDPKHVNALGNLANLMWSKGNHDQADSLYCKALEADPGNENLSWNYARFLYQEKNDAQKAFELLDQAIKRHSESGRLLLLQGELMIMESNFSDAVKCFEKAREKGADQNSLETGYAVALQLSGGAIGECIAAYRTALSMNPNNGALKLNLAQLLFVKGEFSEASELLREAMRLQLDDAALMEAQFYLLAHTSLPPGSIMNRIKSLISQGVRLRWDLQPNIDAVRQTNEKKAALLQLVTEVMRGEQELTLLDQVTEKMIAVK